MSLPDLPFPYGKLQFRPITRVSEASRVVLVGQVCSPVSLARFNAHVKLLPEKEFIAESACAWLARQVGLPAPEAMWICVCRSAYPAAWPYGDEDVHVCFGTRSISNALPLKVESSTAGWLFQQDRVLLIAKIALFDELVGNDDRHQGNLLLGPTGNILVIDHERALGGTAAGLFSSDLIGPNHLLELVRELPAKQRAELKAPLLQFATACAVAVDRLPFDQIAEANPTLKEAAKRFLAKRAASLHDVVLRTLGVPGLPGISEVPLRSAPL